MVSWLPLSVDAFHKTCYAGSQVWYVLTNGTQDSLTGSQEYVARVCRRHACPLCVPRLRYTMTVRDCCLLTPHKTLWAVLADVHKTLSAAGAWWLCGSAQWLLGWRMMATSLAPATVLLPLASRVRQLLQTWRAPHNVSSAGNGGYVSCTSAVLADTTQQPDFDVALYAVVGTILNGCDCEPMV